MKSNEWDGTILKQKRTALGWNLETLSEMLGVVPASIHRWENNKKQPNFDHLIKLLKIFHCKAEDFCKKGE